ncbi:hypothetical protein ACFQKC_08250 [Halovenus rubra]|nr:hypothetical protein [Halovenus rubra]
MKTTVDSGDEDLTEGYEEEQGTDPTVADTDEDGLDDPTEVERVTDATVADIDGDGIEDGTEVSLGTDPLDSDTDGDNLVDGAEVNNKGALPGADPLQMDIFLEIDYMNDYSIPDTELSKIKDEFRTASVTNPDGSNGINLHVTRDNKVSYESVLSDDEWSNIKSNDFDHHGEGYHYVVLMNHTTLPAQPDDNRDLYDGSGGNGFITVTGTADDLRIGTVFMHELGHSLGLSPNIYRGIDSTQISFTNYHSVMSYNTPYDYYGYSGSESQFSDWDYLEENLYTPSTVNLNNSS